MKKTFYNGSEFFAFISKEYGIAEEDSYIIDSAVMEFICTKEGSFSMSGIMAAIQTSKMGITSPDAELFEKCLINAIEINEEPLTEEELNDINDSVNGVFYELGDFLANGKNATPIRINK